MAVFWGNSKILDGRGELVAALLPHLEIRDRTMVMPVYLPRECRGVLFIENQDTYTTAATGMPAEARDLALVYAAGFSRQRSAHTQPLGLPGAIRGTGVGEVG